MKWLFSLIIPAVLVGVLVTRAFDYFFAGMLGVATVGAAKLGIFAGAWTAITTSLGMRDYSNGVKKLRSKTRLDTAGPKNDSVKHRLDT